MIKKSQKSFWRATYLRIWGPWKSSEVCIAPGLKSRRSPGPQGRSNARGGARCSEGRWIWGIHGEMFVDLIGATTTRTSVINFIDFPWLPIPCHTNLPQKVPTTIFHHTCRSASCTPEVAVLKKLHVTQGSCGSAWRVGVTCCGTPVFFCGHRPITSGAYKTATYTSQTIRIHVQIRHNSSQMNRWRLEILVENWPAHKFGPRNSPSRKTCTCVIGNVHKSTPKISKESLVFCIEKFWFFLQRLHFICRKWHSGVISWTTTILCF